MYEVWTLDDHSLSYDEIERIVEDEQERIESLWSCVETFSSEDHAYEFVESLDELDYPLIYDGKDFYLQKGDKMTKFAIKSVVLEHRECDSQIEIKDFEFDGIDTLQFAFTEHVILDDFLAVIDGSEIEVTELEANVRQTVHAVIDEDYLVDEDTYRLTDAKISLVAIECENVVSNYGKSNEEYIFAKYLENYYEEMYFGNYDVIVKVEKI